jgi:hypothetical protein
LALTKRIKSFSGRFQNLPLRGASHLKVGNKREFLRGGRGVMRVLTILIVLVAAFIVTDAITFDGQLRLVAWREAKTRFYVVSAEVQALIK